MNLWYYGAFRWLPYYFCESILLYFIVFNYMNDVTRVRSMRLLQFSFFLIYTCYMPWRREVDSIVNLKKDVQERDILQFVIKDFFKKKKTRCDYIVMTCSWAALFYLLKFCLVLELSTNIHSFSFIYIFFLFLLVIFFKWW